MCERIPYLILPVRQLLRELFGSHRSGRRSAEAPRASCQARRRAHLELNPPPKRRERAVGQDARADSIRTIRRSAVSEPWVKTPGLTRSEPSVEVPQASRQARRWARLDPILCRSAASKPSGQTLGPSRIESSTEAIYERAVWQAAGPASKHAPLCEPPPTPRRPLSDPSSKPLPQGRVRSGAQAEASGRCRYRTEPLRLFAVNPLTVDDFRRTIMWGVILYNRGTPARTARTPPPS